jgi:hypothetical protein
MSISLRKSKMVSFRLSPADYLRFREICTVRGVHSISDLARIAMNSFAATAEQPGSISSEIRDLRSQVNSLTVELDRISQLVEARGKSAGAV